ncbi:MAG TPA: SusC/RagA family TonB-linked outer membrane protein [Petrimonas sp.]|uniref:SusC/RagA family TonB-linked outer membrane protein n=1 Tax=Petrimonas sp. TaxID=2023866 RepID=UPI00096299C1|nr:MAG: SusC/RagA family TonB-linked outer membrane protein [Bacteroidia bacterium 43-41]HHV86725.1 SusC/RagA family TonB-linked outer membrane protein [Petrimonas sp.]
MKKKFFMFLALFLAGIGVLTAQTQVRGTVVDEAGIPIIGATIQVKGTAQGTVTDLDGQFTLTAPANATLVISYVGLVTQEVPVSPRVNVTLVPDTELLQEVVVTALGITREKKSLGSAVQNVNADELVKAASPNVISSLSGKIAGMQVNQAGGQIGASSRIVLRGNSSLGDNQPLIVIDGIPISNSSTRQNSVDYGSGLNDINPQDIESVSVLKGGAAAALYGMRAGHGVILITTKSGSNRSKGVEIDYDGNFNVDQVYSFQKMQNKYGQGYYGDEYSYNFIAKEDGYTGSYQDFAMGGYTDADDLTYGFKYIDGLGNGVNDNMDASWGPRLDIGLMIPQYSSPVDANGNYMPTPWISHPSNTRDAFRTGTTTNHNISLTSRTDHSNTRLSIGYRDQKGVLPNTTLKRYNAGVNSTMSLTKLVDVNVVMNYTRTESPNMPLTEYNASNIMQSMGQWFGRQVDMKDLKARWQETMPNGYPYNWNSSYHNNPFWSLNKNTNSFQKNRVFGKTSLFIMPTEYLKFEGRLGLDYYDSMSNPIVTYRSNEVVASAGEAKWDGGWFRLNNLKNTELNADFIAYFNKNFDDISVHAFAGANYRNLRWSSSTLGADLLTVPDLFTISNVKGSPVTAMDNVWIRSNSLYTSLSLGYRNFAYIDGTLRKDWSSTLRTPFSYPSISASFLPLEAFNLTSDIFTFLKLRGGWAQVGSATGSYEIDPYFTAAASTFNGVTQYYQAEVFPPSSLQPEKVETTEIGLEASMFKGRLGFDIALYNKTTTNQILKVAVSKATGYNEMLINAGNFNNKGIEVQLYGTPVKTQTGFQWNVTLNWAKDKSIINELYTDPVTNEPLASYEIGNQWSTKVQARPGSPWGDIYGTGMLRRKSDGAIIVNAGGRPRTQTNMKLGNVTPDWLGGLRNEFSYKGISFGFLLDMRKGGDIFSVSNMFGAYSGLLEYTALGEMREKGLILGKDFMTDKTFVKVVKADSKDIQNSEFAENDITTSAQDFFESYYGNRELSIYDGSYLKLREAYITYQLPKTLFGASNFVKGGSISLVGTNLAILWRHKSNMSGLDPENTVTSDNGGVGLETTSYPPSRSIGIKLNLKF